MGPPTIIDGQAAGDAPVARRNVASMGPPTLIGGQGPAALLRVSSEGGFNGPADSHRRTVEPELGLYAVLDGLQWVR